MFEIYLSERWREEIKKYLKTINSKYQQISIDNFNNNLKIEFDDGSQAFFNFAFYIAKPDWNEIAVFTEHNGYHIYPLLAVKVQTIDRITKKIIKTEDYRTD